MLRYTVSQKNCGLPKNIASPKPKTKTNIIKVSGIWDPNQKRLRFDVGGLLSEGSEDSL